ncbi:hypothetical protein MMC25_006172 [Agyrium rufum]|nr:hypothetical protein [Agyrium rufum]
MATTQRIRGRPAHPSGPTFLTYTPNGRKLITAGSNKAVRVYTTGSDGEPTNIDDCQENNFALAASNDFFLTGSEEGKVCMYSLETFQYEKILTRYAAPIRDLAISPDGQWAAVASDELVIKIVQIEDMTRVLYIRDLPKPPKHLSYDPSGTLLTISSTDGVIYMYSLSSEEPQLIRKIDGVIRSLDSEAESSSKAVWHPDGRGFAVPNQTRDVVMISKSNGEKQKTFTSGHTGDITDLAWSPNGAFLATSGSDRKILLWETKTQTIIARYEYPDVTKLAWHSHDNMFSFTTSDGELFIYPNFVSAKHSRLLEDSLHQAPMLRDPLSEVSGNEERGLKNGNKPTIELPRRRQRTPDSLDDILPPDDDDEDLDDFVVDDDGAGYALGMNNNGKRTSDALDFPDSKRRAYGGTWEPKIHPSFQPGSTTWRGDRRYLCLNLTGFVWTVDQTTHHTVTVEFHDREEHRGFHFTDPYLYDKACLNNTGTLFSSPPNAESGSPVMLFYRPHSTWTTRTDWRTSLPEGEDIVSISLSSSYVICSTTAGYLRVYTLYGHPVRISRLKSSPTVTCVSWHDYVMTLSNGPMSGTGSQLVYTIENIKRDEVLQSEDIVALAPNTSLKSVFFSEDGDPYIYDSAGVLLVLLHWRTAGQARWVPLLDTKQLDRLAGGRKEETYWPVAVAGDRFHCIILKGGDTQPYFPRRLLSEFEFKVPVSGPPKQPHRPASPSSWPEPAEAENTRLEASYLLSSILLELHSDLLSSTNSIASQRADLAKKQVDVDKFLLQCLNLEAREGEERGEKCLEIVKLMKDRSGKMVGAAEKVAMRYGRVTLAEKIREVGERLLGGVEDGEQGDEF